jgi:hypothetical protein
MSKTVSFSYRISVLYRFIIAFILGYICTSLLIHNLTLILNTLLPKAESIYLAAFISLLFFIGFVISSFCIYTVRKLSLISFSLLICLAVIYWILG